MERERERERDVHRYCASGPLRDSRQGEGRPVDDAVPERAKGLPKPPESSNKMQKCIYYKWGLSTNTTTPGRIRYFLT